MKGYKILKKVKRIRIKQVSLIILLVISTSCFGQKVVSDSKIKPLLNYSMKDFDQRVDLLDSILHNYYPNNFDDIFFIQNDLWAISDVGFNHSMVSVSSDDNGAFIVDRKKYNEYIKKLRLFAEELRKINKKKKK